MAPMRSIEKSSASKSHTKSDEIFIAVMGASGTGKSSFINTVSNSNFPVGNGLKSCTSNIQVSERFQLKSIVPAIRLIDTPGFDDTSKSDVDTLNLIAEYLADSYRKNRQLSGIIYMHRITDVRMGGVSKRNFMMFRNLCGTNAIKNVVIITSMWGAVDDKIGAEREKELKSDKLFFKPALSGGAKISRYEGTPESAEKILQFFKANKPMPLLVQEEMVDHEKNVVQTAAGMELQRELLEQTAQQKKQIEDLVNEMEQAAKAQDERTRKELEGERRKVLDEIARLEAEGRKFTLPADPSPQIQVQATSSAGSSQTTHARKKSLWDFILILPQNKTDKGSLPSSRPSSPRPRFPTSLRLAPPDRRFVECHENDLKLSEVSELLREYKRLVGEVRAIGGFNK